MERRILAELNLVGCFPAGTLRWRGLEHDDADLFVGYGRWGSPPALFVATWYSEFGSASDDRFVTARKSIHDRDSAGREISPVRVAPVPPARAYGSARKNSPREIPLGPRPKIDDDGSIDGDAMERTIDLFARARPDLQGSPIVVYQSRADCLEQVGNVIIRFWKSPDSPVHVAMAALTPDNALGACAAIDSLNYLEQPSLRHADMPAAKGGIRFPTVVRSSAPGYR